MYEKCIHTWVYDSFLGKSIPEYFMASYVTSNYTGKYSTIQENVV